MTREQDRCCPRCGGILWVRTRRRAKHSSQLWLLISLRVAICVGCLQLAVVALAWLTHRLTGDYEPLRLLPAYLGLRHADAALAQAAFEIVPRVYLSPALLLSGYSLALLLGMWARWRPVYYLMVGGAAFRLILSLVLVLLGQPWATYCGGLGLLLSAAAVPALLSVADDFAWDSARMFFGLDGHQVAGAARLERAQALAEEGMWALAALYLRAAAAKLPGHSGVYARLARAYLRLDRHDLAIRTLEDAGHSGAGDRALMELAYELRASQPTAQQEGAGRSLPLDPKVHL